ncbi:MAG: TonB C-terminal domain-containing protein [Pontibacterium sp.]
MPTFSWFRLLSALALAGALHLLIFSLWPSSTLPTHEVRKPPVTVSIKLASAPAANIETEAMPTLPFSKQKPKKKPATPPALKKSTSLKQTTAAIKKEPVTQTKEKPQPSNNQPKESHLTKRAHSPEPSVTTKPPPLNKFEEPRPSQQTPNQNTQPKATNTGSLFADSLRLIQESHLAQSTFTDSTLPKRLSSADPLLSSSDLNYLTQWTKIVEALGQTHIPRSLLPRTHSLQLRMLVTLAENGEVLSTAILTSSGDDKLDKQAQSVVQLGSPYPTIPYSVIGAHNMLEIERLWIFEAQY